MTRAARSLGASVKHNVRIKRRKRGLDEACYVKLFLVPNAVGGECLDDSAAVREDVGMTAPPGYEPPSPEAADRFRRQLQSQIASGSSR